MGILVKAGLKAEKDDQNMLWQEGGAYPTPTPAAIRGNIAVNQICSSQKDGLSPPS